MSAFDFSFRQLEPGEWFYVVVEITFNGDYMYGIWSKNTVPYSHTRKPNYRIKVTRK